MIVMAFSQVKASWIDLTTRCEVGNENVYHMMPFLGAVWIAAS
jgi:hypothetical protein